MRMFFGQIVFEDLAKAREGFVLASDLHLIYEVTPTYVELEPDWRVFYKRYLDLSPVDQVSYWGFQQIIANHVRVVSIPT